MREGSDVTVVAIGRMVPEALQGGRGGREGRDLGRGDRPADAAAARRGDDHRVGEEDDALRHRARGRHARRLRRRARGRRSSRAPSTTSTRRSSASARSSRRSPFAPAMEQWVVPHAADVLEAVKRTVARALMATEVKLPRLGQGMESGTIVKWLKGEGEPVKKREPLYELDTDKVTQEVEAEADGVLLKIVVDSGEVEVGRTIAFIGSEGEDVPSGNGGAPAARPSRTRRRSRSRTSRRPRAARRRGWTTSARAARRLPPRPPRRRPPRSPTRPRARTAASRPHRSRAGSRARRGSTSRPLQRQRPRGPDRRRGRRARRRRARRRPLRQRSPRPAGEVEEIELTSTRKTIARRLTEAWQAPVFQLTVSVDMTRVARAARAARRAPARGRDEADRQRPADEGGRGRARCATRR